MISSEQEEPEDLPAGSWGYQEPEPPMPVTPSDEEQEGLPAMTGGYQEPEPPPAVTEGDEEPEPPPVLSSSAMVPIPQRRTSFALGSSLASTGTPDLSGYMPGALDTPRPQLGRLMLPKLALDRLEFSPLSLGRLDCAFEDEKSEYM